MSNSFINMIMNRRSFYAISKNTNISNEQIQQLIEAAIQYTPSAFHSQSACVSLLFGEEHLKLWNIVEAALQKIVPEDRFQPTKEKLASFAAGYGTVLFFDDTAVVNEYQDKFQTYKDNFPIWAQQSNGMLQLVVWTALETEGFGASLQHYNPIIDEEVRKQWKLPDTWQLIAQMPFGLPTAQPEAKTFRPISERSKVFG